MGGGQSGQAEREVTVEERGGGEDGQPQIIVRVAAALAVKHQPCFTLTLLCVPTGDAGLPAVRAG